MSKTYRWGFLSASGIANTVAEDFKHAGLVIHAVGARDLERAQVFAAKHDIPVVYGSYEELVADTDIDIVYVSTVQTMHFQHALLALNAGKHVLLEKPFTINADQAEHLKAAALRNNVMILEAMWTRFLPAHRALAADLEAGVIGKPMMVTADHSQYLPQERVARLWSPELGGGALLDLGIYPVSFANFVFGAPGSISAQSTLTADNLDIITSGLFGYEDGSQAAFTTTMAQAGPVTASILGTEGRIEIDTPFYCNVAYSVYDSDNNLVKRVDESTAGRGMQHQAVHLEECLRAGLLDSPILPIDESISIMQTMDAIRAIGGIKYPGE